MSPIAKRWFIIINIGLVAFVLSKTLLHAQAVPKPTARPVQALATAGVDSRNIATGFNIPSEGYADQPYIVKTDDGAWLCAITTGTGHEGATGQHVVSMRSTDRGRTWEKPVDIEPATVRKRAMSCF